ncbi:MAG: alpha/beta hydrolase [Pseudomonadota bacterium]
MPSSPPKDLIRPIEHLEGRKPPAPQWFEDAIAAPSEEASVEVAGAKVRYSAWGEVGRRGLLFVHGGRAHRNWWRPFAPFFSNNYRVAALDLSGGGDSDWRENYSLDLAIDEIFAVIEAAGLASHGRPIVVGHSFGGWLTLAAVEREGERLAGAVVIDSPISKPDPDEGYTIVSRSADPKTTRPHKLYPTIEEPVSRFRFLPNQACEEHYLVDYIAREGLTDRRDGPLRAERSNPGEGWSWKFDPFAGTNFHIHFERDLFLAARCPLAFIYGGASAFSVGEGYEAQKKQLVGRVPFIEMPCSAHHLMMDAPLAFTSTLRTLLTCWPVRVGL